MVVQAAGFVIFRRTSQIEYLLMQASYGEFHWSPPKGHVDQGESEFETALRETEEEAGFRELDLKIFTNFKKTLRYEVKGKQKTVVYWLAELINKDTSVKISSEHQAYKWLPLEEACKQAGYSDMSDLLKQCDIFINQS